MSSDEANIAAMNATLDFICEIQGFGPEFATSCYEILAPLIDDVSLALSGSLS